MKEFEVTFTLNHSEIVEADTKADAEQEFSEMFSSGADLLDYGTTTVKAVGKVKKPAAKYLLIDAYDHTSRIIGEKEAKEWIEGEAAVKGARKVWNCEEAIIVKL